jgi:hypothetical protein
MSGPGDRNNDNDDNRWTPTSTPGETGKTKGDGSGGGSSDGGGPNPCMFTEVTILASPNPAVINTLVVGDILSVTLSGVRVVAQTVSGIAGAITSAKLPEIIQCLSAGQQYAARVTTINGGAVTVEIYPA